MIQPTMDPRGKRIAASLLSAIAVCLCTVAHPTSHAAEIASPEPGWPQFRGPKRNGISEEKGLLPSWPEGGPRLIWSITNVGSGYSAPIIGANTIYITGDVGEELHILALDLAGKLIWRTTNGGAWKNPYPGARSSCTYAGGRLFHMNGHGRAACFDARTGREVWTLDVPREFDSKVSTWGVAESLLVDGTNVMVTPGGRKASMAALNKDTGNVVWICEALSAGEPGKIEGPAYAPPILMEIFGQRHIVGVTARHFFGVRAGDGKLQWSYDMPTRHEVLASSATFCDGGVFVTGPDGDGGKFLRFTIKDGVVGVEPVWTSTLDTCHGGMIALDGFLYGSWYRSFNGWGCVKAKDGSVSFRTREMAMGSATYADGRLYCLSQTGTMALVTPKPEKWEVASRFQLVTEHQNNVWTHPVILDGRLYLRYQQTLWCYDVRRTQP